MNDRYHKVSRYEIWETFKMKNNLCTRMEQKIYTQKKKKKTQQVQEMGERKETRSYEGIEKGKVINR